MEKLTVQIVQTKLFEVQDLEYRKFMAPLIPNVDKNRFIGVRTPALRAIAKNLWKNYDCLEFLETLPHKYFEENQLHGFLLGEDKNFERCVAGVERFLPFIDNWATCDQCSPKIFKKHAADLIPLIEKWIDSGETYSMRFAIRMLMQYFLDETFNVKFPGKVAELCREHTGNANDNYYINMMVSWYFATALAKQWNSTFPFIEKHRLNDWCHRKTIQKAKESFRVSDEHKSILKKYL